MTKKFRLTILLFCVVCFLLVAPILVLYSMGNRFDFTDMKITTTGGIYVRTFPAAEQIIIDSKILEKPGMFSNSIFVQSLLPGSHTVLIKKNDYYDYFKTLPVQKKLVTKLENVLLVKRSIEFHDIADKIGYFFVAPNKQNIITASAGTKNTTFNYSSLSTINQLQTPSATLPGKLLDIKWSDDSSMALIEMQNQKNIFYYIFDTVLQKTEVAPLSYLDKNTQQISFNPQNSQELFFIKNNILYSEQNNNILPIINNADTYKISGNNIIWVSKDGLLYRSNITGELIKQLTIKNITADATQDYKIFVFSDKIFLQANDFLFLLNQDTKTLEDITPPETNYKILASLDNKNLVFQNADKIYLYSFEKEKYEKIFSGDNITNLQWLNNDYIIFTDGDKIIISEIDYRGNINAITLPQTVTISLDEEINIKEPQIFFNHQDSKLYILTNNTLLLSEKLIP